MKHTSETTGYLIKVNNSSFLDDLLSDDLKNKLIDDILVFGSCAYRVINGKRIYVPPEEWINCRFFNKKKVKK